jgi:hypothetical protein
MGKKKIFKPHFRDVAPNLAQQATGISRQTNASADDWNAGREECGEKRSVALKLESNDCTPTHDACESNTRLRTCVS